MGAASSDRRIRDRKGGIVAFKDPRLAVDLHRREVEGMMYEGVSFDEVEDVIDAAELALDEKAALWLLAWSLEKSCAGQNIGVGWERGRLLTSRPSRR
jgi:hypothetical protein